MDYKKAIEYVVKRRKDELYAASALFDSALENNPALRETETEIRRLTLMGAKGEKTDKSALKALEKKKADLLLSMGLTKKILSPEPHCALCGDSGLIRGGKICSCVKSLAINSENNVKIALRKFSDADFSLSGAAAKEHNETVFANVKKILERFPNNKKRNIVLLGGTGTGKTFLSGCAADFMLERGDSVTAVTAFDFVSRALAYHTTFDDKKQSHIAPLLDSSLLIIDDLGTESIFKNITLEYLYTVLNERMYGNKLTMFTSNLSADAILSRYGERIYSRMFDKSLSYTASLTGDDLRLKKR